ncbi:MAG: copper resistance protein [Proteobacteria bacterium]|nr:copper resistance protein [Pseudomonadota bacterium]
MLSRFVLFAAILVLASAQAFRAAAHGPDDHGGHAHGATVTDGQPGSPADVKRTVRVLIRKDDFDVKTIQVRAGETVRFVITNDDLEPHEFGIASHAEHLEHRAMMKQMPNMRHDDPNVVTVDPSQTKEIVWHFGKNTDVEFSCDLPGHAERGMAGNFRVMH